MHGPFLFPILLSLPTPAEAMKKESSTKKSRQQQAVSDRAMLLRGLPVAEKQQMLAGISTTYLEGGDGPTLLLLHGPGESSLWWMLVLPELVHHYRVIVPDLPGHGASGLPPDGIYPDAVLSWLEALITATATSPPLLAGHVLGGAIAARYAIRSPGGVSHLILIDSLGLASFRPAPMFAVDLFRFLLRPNQKSYMRFLPHCLYDLAQVKQRMGEKWDSFLSYNLACASRPEGKAALRSYMAKIGTPKLSRVSLENLAVPVSLIWGRQDLANKLTIAQKASQRWGWPLQVIDNCRDDPRLDQPEAFVNALRTAISAPPAVRQSPRKNQPILAD
jgi:pimeloyl-ACP methyl ester carboxylesterase